MTIHLLALPALLTGSPLAAQRLEIRGAAPRVLGVDLAPALGINPDSLRSTGRGVHYYDVQVGTGDAVAVGDELSVHYVGFLSDGTRFAATNRTPFRFRVGDGRVIAGWEDGVIGMRVGGRRQLVIPAFLGYGQTGKGSIPPDAVLVFDLTLIGKK